MIPLLHPLYAASLTPAGENENHPRPAGGETLHSPFAASAEFEHVERGTFRAICSGEFVHIRATGIASLKTERPTPSQVRLPASHFQSATRIADTGGLRGSSLLAFRLRFKSVWPLKAARRLIPGLSVALQACKQSARRFANRFHLTPFALTGLADVLDGHQQIRRKLKCPTKALKGETR